MRRRIVKLMPHELVQIKSQMEDFYNMIDLPEAAQGIDKYIHAIRTDMERSPYQFVFVSVEGSGADERILGYVWFYIEVSVLGEPQAVFEHDYVIPEIRDTLKGARVHKELLDASLNIGQRCQVVRINTVVKSDKLLKSREKMGFEKTEQKLTFHGDVTSFRNHNPVFMSYIKSEER